MKTIRGTLATALVFGRLAAFAAQADGAGGVPLWTNRYHGPGNGDTAATALAVDRSGNVLVTGYSFGSGSGNDYATIKYSGAGMPLWTNRYNGPDNYNDYGIGVAVDAGGNVFVTGQSQYSNDVTIIYDYATVAYSGAGLPLWTNRYGDTGNSLALAIAVDGSGNVFVTGTSSNTTSGFDYATVAYSGAGVPLWTNRYNGPLGDRLDYPELSLGHSRGQQWQCVRHWILKKRNKWPLFRLRHSEIFLELASFPRYSID